MTSPSSTSRAQDARDAAQELVNMLNNLVANRDSEDLEKINAVFVTYIEVGRKLSHLKLYAQLKASPETQNG